MQVIWAHLIYCKPYIMLPFNIFNKHSFKLYNQDENYWPLWYFHLASPGKSPHWWARFLLSHSGWAQPHTILSLASLLLSLRVWGPCLGEGFFPIERTMEKKISVQWGSPLNQSINLLAWNMTWIVCTSFAWSKKTATGLSFKNSLSNHILL